MNAQFRRRDGNAVMLTTERHFRVLQVFCILAVLTCFQVALKVDKTSPEITPMEWFLIGMGGWAIASGFILERKMCVVPKCRVAQLDPLHSVAGELVTSFAS